MSLITTPAICLKRLPTGKTSATLFLLCRSLGVITLHQKGFFHPTSKWLALFDLGQELMMTLKKNQKAPFLSEARLKRNIAFNDYTALTLASFLFELLANCSNHSFHDVASLYDDFRGLLLLISEQKRPLKAFLYFQFQLLHQLGLLGDSAICHHCDRPFHSEEGAFALKGIWSFSCRSCLPHSPPSLVLSPQERNLFNTPKDFLEIQSHRIAPIQKHLHTIYEDYFYLRTPPLLLKFLE